MIENILKTATESRIQNRVISHLFDAYCQYGLLGRTAEILESVPVAQREPILHTLGAHVTKEKPVLVYSVLSSTEHDIDESTTLAGMVDLLWALSLVYDDLYDQDQQRSGLQSAWVKFGSKLASESIQVGLDTVKSYMNRAFGQGSDKLVDRYVDIGLRSLRLHREMDPNVPLDELLDNYRARALFHTGLPFALVNRGQFKQDPAFLALENVNLAGQILNDLKDFSPRFEWLRDSFSDIRSGVMTVPVAILLERLSEEERRNFLRVFGSGTISISDRNSIRWLFNKSGAVEAASDLIRKLYNTSLAQFRSVLKPEFISHTEEWVDYKLNQIENVTEI